MVLTRPCPFYITATSRWEGDDMIAKVRCPFCGAYDQLSVGLDFSVGSRCWCRCEKCSKPFLVIYTKNGCETARLSPAVMDDSEADRERYLLYKEIELREKLGLLEEEEWILSEDLYGDKTPGLEGREPQEDEFRCVYCQQAISVPLSKEMTRIIAKKNPAVVLTFCQICGNAIGVILTGSLFSEEITKCFQVDWDELFWEEGEAEAQKIIEAKVREDFNIPESFEVRFFHDELPDDPNDEEPADLSEKISDEEAQHFVQVDLSRLDDRSWWADGGLFQE